MTVTEGLQRGSAAVDEAGGAGSSRLCRTQQMLLSREWHELLAYARDLEGRFEEERQALSQREQSILMMEARVKVEREEVSEYEAYLHRRIEGARQSQLQYGENLRKLEKRLHKEARELEDEVLHLTARAS